MSGALFKKGASAHAETIQTLDMAAVEDPRAYIPSPGLEQAISAALILGKPLLITGEPGAGKTQLANAVAYELGEGAAHSEGAPPKPVPVWKFETKSTSAARDLFYTYDAIAAFQSANADREARREASDFLTFQALGRAILEAFPADHEGVRRLWPNPADPAKPERDRHQGPRRSVVLIDEIDKAPRDFPNDLLNEIERLYFRVPEFENRASPNEDGQSLPRNMRPIIIVTSNSEKTLPDPFLRRCVYFHVEFPGPEEMRKILRARLPGLADDVGLVTDALSLFYQYRGEDGGPQIRKQPSTAELIDFVNAVAANPNWRDRAQRRALFEQNLSALIKTTEDRKIAVDHVRNWTPAEA